jgi:hypothetical protein
MSAKWRNASRFRLFILADAAILPSNPVNTARANFTQVSELPVRTLWIASVSTRLFHTSMDAGEAEFAQLRFRKGSEAFFRTVEQEVVKRAYSG